MPEGFTHNGQRYEWNYQADTYEPVDVGASTLKTIEKGTAMGLGKSINALNELFGYDTTALNQQLEQEFQQAGGTTIAPDIGGAAATGGQVLPFLMGGVASAGAGLPAVAGIEALMGFGMTPGQFQERATGAALGAASVGVPVAAVQAARLAGSGIRQMRMNAATDEILSTFKDQADAVMRGARDTVDSYKIQYGVGDTAQPSGSTAGAAQIDQGLGANRLFPDERAEIFGDTLTPSQTAILDAPGGEVTSAMRKAQRRERATDLGVQAIDDAEGNFTTWLSHRLGAGGRFDRTALSDAARDVVGPAIGDILEQANVGKLSPEFMDNVATVVGEFPDSALLKRAGKMLGNVKDAATMSEARNELTKMIRSAKKLPAQRAALEGLRDDLLEAVVKDLPENLRKAYSEEKMKYAVLMRLLEGENIIGGANKFNVKSLVNKMSAEYEPFRTGQDMSDIGRALRTMQDIQMNFTEGPGTAEKLAGGMLQRGLGLLGF